MTVFFLRQSGQASFAGSLSECVSVHSWGSDVGLVPMTSPILNEFPAAPAACVALQWLHNVKPAKQAATVNLTMHNKG